jgi:ATP-dependent Clp protease ATP-binding subunit ClpC
MTDQDPLPAQPQSQAQSQKPDRFTPETRQLIEMAKQSVLAYRDTHIKPEHLLLALIQLQTGALNLALGAAHASREQIAMLVKHHLRPGPEEPIPDHLLTFSERAKRVIETAWEESRRAKAQQIGPEHILLGLTRVSNTICGAVLRAVDVNTDSVRKTLNIT